MGYIKTKRPLDVRTPGSSGATATADGIRGFTARFDLLHYQSIASASSAGTTIGPRGLVTLSHASSAGATSPIIMYLASPTSGDVIEISALAIGASSNTISLRTSSSGTYIGSTGTEDSILFGFPGQSCRLVAASCTRWLALSQFSTVATGSSGAPALLTSTS